MIEYITNTIPQLFLVSEIVLLIMKRSKKAEVKVRKDRQSMLILWLVFILSISSSFYLTAIYPRTEQLEYLQWAGVIIVAMGFVVRWSAIYQLKDAFTVDVSISNNHQIKDDGLYRIIRHPSYTGLLLELLGMSLLFNSWLPLLLINIPSFIALSYRIKIEEELLTEAFGGDYTDYKKRTKRLIPFIY